MDYGQRVRARNVSFGLKIKSTNSVIVNIVLDDNFLISLKSHVLDFP